MKIIKITLATIIIVPLLLVAAVALIPGKVDFSMYQSNIENYIKSKTGFQVSLGDNVSIHLLPHPYVKAENVRVKSFNGEKDLFHAKRLELEASLKDLVRMNLSIKKMFVEDPIVYLHSDVNSVANWQKKSVKRRGGKVDLSFITGFGNVVVSNASFVYENDLSGQQFKLEDGQFALNATESENAKLNVSAVLNGEEFVSNFDLNLNDLDDVKAKGSFDFSGNHYELDGQLYNALYNAAYEGGFLIEGDSPLSAIYGVVNVAPGQRMIDLPLTATGMVNLNDDVLKFDNVQVTVNTSETTVDLNLNGQYEISKSRKKKDMLTLAVTSSKVVDLSNIEFCKVASTKPMNSSFKWSDDLMDFTPLGLLNADVKVNFVEGMVCKGFDLDSLNAHITLKDKRVDVKELVIGEGEGRLNLTGYLNTKGSTPRGQVSMEAVKVDLTEYATKSLNKRLSAPFDGTAKFNFVGKTQSDWVKSLEGNLDIKTENLEIAGVDSKNLQSLVMSLFGMSKSKAETSNENLFAVKADIKKGILRLTESQMMFEDTKVLLSGKVDLVRLAMNVKATPEGYGVAGYDLPVSIKGSVFKPSVMPSATAAATAVGGAIAGPVGAIVGGAFGLAVESAEDGSLAKTGEEILQEKQRLENELRQFLNNQ